jgi:hypothetical protein
VRRRASRREMGAVGVSKECRECKALAGKWRWSHWKKELSSYCTTYITANHSVYPDIWLAGMQASRQLAGPYLPACLARMLTPLIAAGAAG